jgi:hypothetical protein
MRYYTILSLKYGKKMRFSLLLLILTIFPNCKQKKRTRMKEVLDNNQVPTSIKPKANPIFLSKSDINITNKLNEKEEPYLQVTVLKKHNEPVGTDWDYCKWRSSKEQKEGKLIHVPDFIMLSSGKHQIDITCCLEKKRALNPHNNCSNTILFDEIEIISQKKSLEIEKFEDLKQKLQEKISCIKRYYSKFYSEYTFDLNNKNDRNLKEISSNYKESSALDFAKTLTSDTFITLLYNIEEQAKKKEADEAAKDAVEEDDHKDKELIDYIQWYLVAAGATIKVMKVVADALEKAENEVIKKVEDGEIYDEIKKSNGVQKLTEKLDKKIKALKTKLTALGGGLEDVEKLKKHILESDKSPEIKKEISSLIHDLEMKKKLATDKFQNIKDHTKEKLDAKIKRLAHRAKPKIRRARGKLNAALGAVVASIGIAEAIEQKISLTSGKKEQIQSLKENIKICAPNLQKDLIDYNNFLNKLEQGTKI